MEAILARLLGAGASPIAKDYDGYTPLHWACELGSDYAVRLLLEAGAPVNAVDSEGSTPLHRLCCTKLRGSRLGLNAIGRLLEPLREVARRYNIHLRLNARRDQNNSDQVKTPSLGASYRGTK